MLEPVFWCAGLFYRIIVWRSLCKTNVNGCSISLDLPLIIRANDWIFW